MKRQSADSYSADVWDATSPAPSWGKGGKTWQCAAGKGLVLLLLLLMVAGWAGCGPQDPRPRGTGTSPMMQADRDYLELAVDYLSRLEVFEERQGQLQTAYYLNRWLDSVADDPDWQPTDFVDELPEHLRTIRPLTDLDKRQITTEDVLYLREASWMRSLAEWITEEASLRDAEAWWRDLEEERGEPHAYDVWVAWQLFDWVVRNIQLDPLLEHPAGGQFGDAAQVLARAEPGPGYRTYPWQTLMFGRGDAWQRARVFAGLARQLEIDVVMLAIQEEEERPRPWLPAALIDGSLYLFDTQLGLPIPAEGVAGIATLDQLRAEPGILRQLDVGREHRYPVAAADLDRVVALLDAAPQAVSQRMHLIERQPTSGPPLALAIDPERWSERLEPSGLAGVQLWETPLETWIYREALERRAQEDVQLMRGLVFEEWIFSEDTPLTQGRQQHFRGRFDTEDQQELEGAKALYLRARVPDAMIEQIPTSVRVQQSLGIFRGRQNDAEWEAHLQHSQQMVIRAKQNASFWLALIHFDTGRYEDAHDWLKIRCLDAHEDGPWTAGARYNLARVLERLGRKEAARELLLLDESPQQHGNLLRARALREQMARES